MGIDFAKLHETFHGNVSGGMYAWLAEHLGVSIDSLKSLQVGWAPVVKFARNTGYGWWTIPMRDATARVIGLALRGCTDQGHTNKEGGDVKVLYPGSKPGCFYVVNPEHRQGERGYSNGAHNWTRTSASLLCPTCGKPDGCLVAEEAKASICRVVPSDRKMKFGWLHILKPEGELSAPPLPGKEMVITVEGMSDVCSLFDLGFVAVGRPSNVGGLDILADLVRGRDVVVIGENDKKSDNTWPGKDGATAALQTCKRTARSGKRIYPPEYIKDVRAWKKDYGLTRELLLTRIEESNDLGLDADTLKNNDPSTVADAFLRAEYYVGKHPILRWWESGWYRFDELRAKYLLTKEAVIKQAFYRWARGKQHITSDSGGEVPNRLVADKSLFGNTMDAALESTLVNETNIPVWINGVRGPSPSDLIVFNNGILDVPAFLDGGDDPILNPTPDLFTTAALPFAFDPAARCPHWMAFLQSSLGDDPGKADLLQEWMGYCMTPDTSLQKMVYLWGPPGTGKGRVLDVMESLIGKEQTATSTFSAIAGPFGLHPLVGKLACLVWDIRTSGNAESLKGLEILLGITGGDTVQVNRKNMDALADVHLTTRITMASNMLLDIPDYVGASIRRVMIVRFNRSFYGDPAMDPNLPDKLHAEIAGIANWALVGLRRLRVNGTFTIPASSADAMREWKLATNPVASFISECTNPIPDQHEYRDEVYDCWEKWARFKRQDRISKSEFFNAMASIAPHARLDVEGDQQVYRGIRMKPDVARNYLGR